MPEGVPCVIPDAHVEQVVANITTVGYYLLQEIVSLLPRALVGVVDEEKILFVLHKFMFHEHPKQRPQVEPPPNLVPAAEETIFVNPDLAILLPILSYSVCGKEKLNKLDFDLASSSYLLNGF